MNVIIKDESHIWTPFTQQKDAPTPIHIERAEGVYLYTPDGKKYIDAISSWWVNIHGHTHPYIAQKIAEQAQTLEHVLFAGFTHTPAITLAQNLIEVLPKHFTKIFYSDNGSTAVEVALKMALQYFFNTNQTHKTKIIALENAYHGDTFGAMSAAERNIFNQPFHQHLFEVAHIPLPVGDQIEASISAFTTLAQKGDVAAFIFEPLVQGAGGMTMYQPTELDRLIQIAHQNNILCIADEVMTGFGRTGKLFASNHLTQHPDLICLSKGITGGFLPLAVTATTQPVFDAFYSDDPIKTFFHGHSYTANPISCAAAIASLELLQMDTCQKQIAMITKSHKNFLKKIYPHPFIRQARQTGTILALELNTPESTSYTNTIKTKAQNFFLENGILIRPLGNIIYLMPPYCITQKELKTIYTILEKGIYFLQTN